MKRPKDVCTPPRLGVDLSSTSKGEDPLIPVEEDAWVDGEDIATEPACCIVITMDREYWCVELLFVYVYLFLVV